MHLGTYTVPKATGWWRKIKQGLALGMGGSLQVTGWAVFWCRLQQDGWSCGNRIRDPPGPMAGNPPSLTFRCSQLWWLAAAGWCSRGWSVLSLCELCLSLPVLLPWRQKSVVCFPPTRNSFPYLVTGALYSSSGLWPGCAVLEGWGGGWWPLVTSSGVAAAHDR